MSDNSWNGYERNCLFLNRGATRYSDVATPLGADEVRDTRGVAVTDLDRDGRLDLVLAHELGPPTVLLNRLPPRPWRQIDLIAISPHPAGSLVVLADRDRRQLRSAAIGSGYASQHTATLHFGLRSAVADERLEVRRAGLPTRRVRHPPAEARLRLTLEASP